MRELQQMDTVEAEQHVLQHPVGRAQEELFGEKSVSLFFLLALLQIV